MTDGLEGYLRSEKARYRARDLDILRKFVAHVEGGKTHAVAVQALIDELGAYVSRGQLYYVTKPWRDAHPERVDLAALLWEVVAELAHDLGYVVERTPEALIAWVEARKASRVRPMLPPADELEA